MKLENAITIIVHIKKLNPSDPDHVDVKLLFCRRGSVIVHFSVAFESVDSNQAINLIDDMEIKGLISSLPVVLVNVTADKVPNQRPIIEKLYLTSSTSLRVFWTAVRESITGYQVAYRSNSSEELNSVYTSPHILSVHLENLIMPQG